MGGCRCLRPTLLLLLSLRAACVLLLLLGAVRALLPPAFSVLCLLRFVLLRCVGLAFLFLLPLLVLHHASAVLHLLLLGPLHHASFPPPRSACGVSRGAPPCRRGHASFAQRPRSPGCTWRPGWPVGAGKGGEGGCGRGILLRLVVVGEFADVACRTKAHMSSSADGASGCGLPTSADPVEGHGGSGGAAACPWLGPGAGRAHVGWWLRLLPPTGAVGGRRVDPAPPPPLPLSVFPAQVPSGWPWLLPPTSRAPARVPVPAIATMGRLRCVRGHRRRM